jgi:ABC-2 type transport system permease protein
MVGLPALLAFLFWLGRSQGGQDRSGAQDLFALATRSGLNFAAAALEAMGRFFLVVVVALFAGEPVAGEANWGTLRYLLVRPVPRPRLLRDKLVVALLLGLVAIVLVPIAGLAAGTIAFGWGRLQIPFGSLPTAAGLGRLAVGTGYEAASLSGIAALAFMFSTMTSAPAGPVAAAVGAAIVSQIAAAHPVAQRYRPVAPDPLLWGVDRDTGAAPADGGHGARHPGPAPLRRRVLRRRLAVVPAQGHPFVESDRGCLRPAPDL